MASSSSLTPGVFSAGNKQANIDADLPYILGSCEENVPYPVQEWLDAQSGRKWADYADGQIWRVIDRSGLGPDGATRSVTYYQYSHDRARRPRKGIKEQINKAQCVVEGKMQV